MVTLEVKKLKVFLAHNTAEFNALNIAQVLAYSFESLKFLSSVYLYNISDTSCSMSTISLAICLFQYSDIVWLYASQYFCHCATFSAQLFVTAIIESSYFLEIFSHSCNILSSLVSLYAFITLSYSIAYCSLILSAHSHNTLIWYLLVIVFIIGESASSSLESNKFLPAFFAFSKSEVLSCSSLIWSRYFHSLIIHSSTIFW